jgi:hypothetical protein
MAGGRMVTLNRHFNGLYLRFTASVRVKNHGFHGDCHGNRVVYFFYQVVDDSD